MPFLREFGDFFSGNPKFFWNVGLRADKLDRDGWHGGWRGPGPLTARKERLLPERYPEIEGPREQAAEANFKRRRPMTRKETLKAIRDICGGEHGELKKVGHKLCKHYDASKVECRVLAARKVPDMLDREYEQCRLIVTYYADILLKEEWERSRQLTDHEDLNFPALFRRLHSKSLKGFDLKKGQRYDLEFWFAYVRRSVQRQRIRRLQKLKVLPRDKKCGTCVHLPTLEPFLCRLRDITDKKTGKKYRNPFFRQEREKDDEGCPGYKPKAVSVEDLPKKGIPSKKGSGGERTDRNEDALVAGVDLSMLVEALTEKINDPRTLEKNRDMFRHQRTLIVDLHRLLRQGIPANRMCSELRNRTTEDEDERERLRKKMKEYREALDKFFRSKRRRRGGRSASSQEEREPQ